MDMYTEEAGIIDILKVIGTKMRHLRLTLMKPDQDFGANLAQELTGSNIQPPLCPQLQMLFVTCPQRQYETRILTTLTNLKTVADKRRFETVRCGWYSVPTVTSAKVPIREQWNLKWQDIM